MIVNVFDLMHKLKADDDFLSLYRALKDNKYKGGFGMKYFNNGDISEWIDPYAHSIEEDLYPLLTTMFKYHLLGNTPDEAIKMTTHFFFTLNAISFIWEAIKDKKILCEGKELVFDAGYPTYGTPLPSKENITYAFENNKNISTNIYLQATNNELDRGYVCLIFSIETNYDSISDNNYLSNLRICIKNVWSQKYTRSTLNISTLNVQSLTDLIETAERNI